MFSVHCPEVGAEILLGPSRILSMHNTSKGVTTYFRCRCGTIGVLVSGRGSVDDQTIYHPVMTEERAPATVGAGPMAECA